MRNTAHNRERQPSCGSEVFPRSPEVAFHMDSQHNVVAPSFEPATFLRALAAPYSVRDYPPRGTVFTQGETCDAVYYLQYGQVKLSLLSPQGKEAVLTVVGAGVFFGEGSLGSQAIRMTTATAIMPSSVLRVEKSVMLRALRDEPKFAEGFIAHLLARNIRIEGDLADHLFNFSEKRLARALLVLASFAEDGQRETVIPQITQETLAEIVGTTRSRVSFFM
ncbi:MAG TPA: Crp/Fnr family transcriptional regulator, partial [Xanthomonadales bacterium]|nr:Crp/Fnr family transcriptional regulator [Xanthomonadales bacterium]